jgi:hypothetical protein
MDHAFMAPLSCSESEAPHHGMGRCAIPQCRIRERLASTAVTRRPATTCYRSMTETRKLRIGPHTFASEAGMLSSHIAQRDDSSHSSVLALLMAMHPSMCCCGPDMGGISVGRHSFAPSLSGYLIFWCIAYRWSLLGRTENRSHQPN